MNPLILSRLKHGLKEMLFFNKMITPKVITVCYWMTLASVALGFPSTAREIMLFLPENTIAIFFTTLFAALFGIIGVRIGFELLIVLFKMHDSLQALRRDID